MKKNDRFDSMCDLIGFCTKIKKFDRRRGMQKREYTAGSGLKCEMFFFRYIKYWF